MIDIVSSTTPCIQRADRPPSQLNIPKGGGPLPMISLAQKKVSFTFDLHNITVRQNFKHIWHP